MSLPPRPRRTGRVWAFLGALLVAWSATAALASPAYAEACESISQFNPQIRQPVGEGIAGTGPVDLVEWEGTLDFGDGTTIPISAFEPYEHTFTEPGTYTITSTGNGVQFTADGGTKPCEEQGFVLTTVTVYPLEARFSFEAQEGGDGESSTFAYDGSASIPEGEIVQYFWDFGDGSTAEGPTATHAFSSPGVFTVTLSILDANGYAASTTKTVGTDGFFPVDVGAYVGDNASRAGPFGPGATRGEGGTSGGDGGGGGLLPALLVAVAALGLAGGVLAWFRLHRPAPELTTTGIEPVGAATEPETVGSSGIVHGQERTITDQVQDVVNQWKENIGQDKSEELEKAVKGELSAEDTDRMQREAAFGSGAAEVTSKGVEHGVYTGATDVPAKGLTWIIDWARNFFGGGTSGPAK